MTLDQLQNIAESANAIDREWRTGIERVPQVGYELEAYFAACRAHRDNPRQDHFTLAETDRKFLEQFNPAQCLQLIADLRKCVGALQKYAEGNALRVKPEKEYLYSDPSDKILWLQRSMSDHDDKITARECLASLQTKIGGGV